MSANGQAKTLFEKIWDNHVVVAEPGNPAVLYIDLHLIHEVTSPQAFEGLRLAGRQVRRPEATFATPDHNVPTDQRERTREQARGRGYRHGTGRVEGRPKICEIRVVS